MKLVVGLGNPGRKYQRTRHNVGYAVLAELARKLEISPPKARFHGETVDTELCGEKALLLSPTTFMNLSGTSVREAVDFFKLPLENMLVICDDLNLPLGKLRFRAKGSAGGQKGLRDIIAKLGTEEFARLRIGIGAAPDNWDWADYVLSKFSAEELPAVEQAVAEAADAVLVWAREGIEFCMNTHN
ncbi:MAG: aminoacyl-tRNA hydrolase [Pirellulaceae bacterium]|nr:aminoacyl-tRNA hydrolase [Pirellulaceae bacterium]